MKEETEVQKLKTYELVDIIGRIRKTKKELEENEEEHLVELKRRNIPLGVYPGNEYIVTIGVSSKAEMDPEKTHKKLRSNQRFYQIIRVIKKKAQMIMTKEDIDQVTGEGVTVRTYTFTIKKEGE
jgi:hypothetical protein